MTHRGPFKRPGSINVPVSIGGQVVQSGDIVVGDEDGLVGFPPDEAERLIAALQRHAAAERAFREEIMTGNVRQSWMDRMFVLHGLTDHLVGARAARVTEEARYGLSPGLRRP